jgi:outer membrane usher protein
MLRQQAHRGIWVLALAGIMMIAATPPAWPAGPVVSAAPQPELNPTDRTFSLLVELREGDRKLGEAAIKIAPDDTISVNKAQFASACASLLREEFAAQLRALPAKDGFLTLSALNAAGFKTGFDSATMRLSFTPAVNQRPRGSVRILREPLAGPKAERPARFSGYLNLRAGADYINAPADAGGFSAPRANLEAVLRWEDVVVETEISYDDSDTERGPLGKDALAGFTRRGSRIVHDRPEDALRLQAGDINPPVTGFQRNPDLLGISVERSMRKLRPSENIRPTGERSFRLARPSTVKVELNGTVARQLDRKSVV